MKDKARTALIAGASGLVGGYCLQLLLQDEQYKKVVSIGRRNIDVQHPKLEQRIVDFQDLQSYSQFLQADDVYCCLGTTIKKAGSRDQFFEVDYKYVLRLAHVSAANGARRFMVVSAMGADSKSMFYYNRVKGEMEEALRQVPFRSIHIFRPSLLLGPRQENRPGEKAATILMKGLDFLMVGPLKQYKAIHAQTVAEAMVRAAHHNQKGVHVHLSHEIAEEK